MTIERVVIPANKRLCLCKCGILIDKFDKRDGRERFYKKGHQCIGRHHTERTKQKMSIAKSGSNNHNWKGNAVALRTLRTWVKKYKPKPAYRLCEFCHKKPVYQLELANVTGVYKRDFSNWKYLCHRCLDRFNMNILDIEQWRCCKCGKNKALIDSSGNVRRFVVGKRLYQCYACYRKEYRKKTQGKLNIV